MTEVGIVRKVEGELVWVAAADPQGCASCGACDASASHGGLQLFGTRPKERLLTVRNGAGLSLRAGDRVEYHVSAGKAVKAGFLVLILPILSFVAFYGLLALAVPRSGEALRVLAGAGGLVLAFVANLALRRRGRDYPEVQRVLGAEAALAEAALAEAALANSGRD